MHGSTGAQKFRPRWSRCQFLRKYRAAASIPAAAARSQKSPTFHNYKPRIAPAQGKGPDGIFRQVRIDGEPTIVNVADQLRPLFDQITQRIAELARGQSLRH